MPFTTETAKDAGRKGGRVLSEAQLERNRKVTQEKTRAAQENGLKGGAPRTATCTCGKLPHVSPCPVYRREKKRESRKRAANT